MIINCLDLTATFIDSDKIPNCQTLLTALSFQLKAQGSAAEGVGLREPPSGRRVEFSSCTSSRTSPRDARLEVSLNMMSHCL